MSKREKSARVPARGRESPKRGRTQNLRGCDTLATTASPPSITQDVLPPEGPPSRTYADAPVSTSPAPESEDDLPVLDLPMVSDIPKGPVQMNQYRLPPTGSLGKDANGKVIPHFRSEETALLVAAWISRGASENFVCAMLNIRPGQLRECYPNEIRHSAEFANMQVAGKAYEMALSGESEGMTKFWLQSRAKWRTGEGDDKSASLFNIHIHTD